MVGAGAATPQAEELMMRTYVLQGHDRGEHGDRLGVDRAVAAIGERHEHPPVQDLAVIVVDEA